MALPAGKRDRKARFFRKTATETPMGAFVGSAEDTIATVWASLNYGKASERMRAGAEGSVNTATARILRGEKTSEIDSKCFCELDGAIWGVTGVAPWGRGELDITLLRRT